MLRTVYTTSTILKICSSSEVVTLLYLIDAANPHGISSVPYRDIERGTAMTSPTAFNSLHSLIEKKIIRKIDEGNLPRDFPPYTKPHPRAAVYLVPAIDGRLS